MAGHVCALCVRHRALAGETEQSGRRGETILRKPSNIHNERQGRNAQLARVCTPFAAGIQCKSIADHGFDTVLANVWALTERIRANYVSRLGKARRGAA